MTHGRNSMIKHRAISQRVEEYLDSSELMSIRSAVATAWAVIDTMLEDDETVITGDRASDVIAAMSKIGTLIKQHHDITEGQKIVIEVPQFMEWAQHLYELAIRYLTLSGGDVRGFLHEAQQYYSGAVSIVTGDSPPAIGDGSAGPVVDVLRSGEQTDGGEEGAEGPDLLRGEVHPPARRPVDEGNGTVPKGHGVPLPPWEQV